MLPNTVKTRSGRTLRLNTPEEDAAITKAAESDPDVRPLTDAEWADVLQKKRGRPFSAEKKELVSLRFDADVLEGLKATGHGWRTRVNDAMREWLKTHPA
ncbi:MAG: BrnA antitoxin family protein [Zoogloeaceae bacterium]|jgi:uncharacterized protein (DUF4415 family)|nr:BrnA antitoxin family protein [Zoogloeaceae bacterium]